MNLERVSVLLCAWILFLITAVALRFHRHDWVVNAVDHGVMNQPRRNATAILYVCSVCGDAKSTTVAGTYGLEQIRGAQHTELERQTTVRSIRWSAEDRKFARTMKLSL